ncbi:TIGR00725 family protein [Candidatus Woesearchaeota archaeon]|nr:TIGR00725 family protein [Candidatus Woesearchaeota archaeon]
MKKVKVEKSMDYDKVKYINSVVKKSKRPLQIAVLGSSEVICSVRGYNMAFEVGQEIAKRKAVTLTGGGLGVMEAALKGAKKEGGVTLAIVPWESMSKVNNYADIVVATGIGWSRNSINLNSCDGAIIVQGGAGTLNEATYGYMMSKPIVALTTSGGMAEEISDKYFDERKTEFVYGAVTPKEAVKKIFDLVKKAEDKGKHLSELDKDLLSREEKQDWKIIIKDAKKTLKKKSSGRVVKKNVKKSKKRVFE